MITVKDVSGAEHNIASRGTSIAGLTTGIIGSALGGLGLLGGEGGGLFGGNGGGISKDQYYLDRITDIRELNAVAAGLTQQICELRERAAVAETANIYQNRITDIGFANLDQRFSTERLVTDYEIKSALCGVIKAKQVLTPDMLAEPFVKTDRVLDSHRVFPFGYGPRQFDDGNFGCGCGY